MNSIRSYGLPLLALASLLAACDVAAQIGDPPPTPLPEAELPEVELPDVSDWRPEHLEFPPSFAPHFPAGEEDVLFAPGFFEQGAENFWSYAFAIDLESDLSDPDDIRQFFEDYFDGLLRSVGGSRGRDLPDPAQVQMEQVQPGLYRGEATLINAFGNFEVFELNMDVALRSTGDQATRIDVMASPQAREHSVWLGLEAASLALGRSE